MSLQRSRHRSSPPAYRAGLALVLLLAWLPGARSEAQSSVPVWIRWQQSLTSECTYTNAYKDVLLRVDFHKTDPVNPVYSGYGYWDGGRTFMLRTAFPSTGSWTWKTSCLNNSCQCNGHPDTGLSGKSGPVTVNPYVDPNPNPLYVNGFLKVSTQAPAAGRYLSYDNGQPFFWLGDTAWSAPPRITSVMAEWGPYLIDRRTKGFSVVQLAPYTGYAVPTPPPPPPFEQVAGCTPDSAVIPNSCSRWNPAYWNHFDEMVLNVNSFHQVALVAGVMEPIDDSFPLEAHARTFARNLVARLSGDFVIFSPGFDARVSERLALIRAVGNEINAATSRHLITDHVAAEPGQPTQIHVHGETWLDFDMVNSGKGGGGGNLQEATRRARVQPLFLYQQPTTKPVVNGEAIYDRNDPAQPLFSDFRARQCGYLSMLSGAVGYTYGADPVALWGWNTSTTPAVAQGWPSSSQMRYLGNLFRSVRWERLAPTWGPEGSASYGLITNQVPTDHSRKMALAYDRNGTFLLAYLPDNANIDINLGSLPSVPRNGRWFNPRTGNYHATAANGAPQGGNVFRYSRPATGDWVLVLGTTSAAAAASGRTVQVWTEPRLEGEGADLRALVSGGRPIAVSDPRNPGFDRLPAVAMEPGGSFLVAWQRDDRILARHFDPSGRPTAEEIEVGAGLSAGGTAPALAADAAGNFVVTWIGLGEGGLFARRFDRRGVALDEPFQVTGSRGALVGYQQVAFDLRGRFLVAWEDSGPEGEGTRVFARGFDGSGVPLGPERRVGGAGSDAEVLTALTVDPLAGFEVRWRSVGRDGRRQAEHRTVVPVGRK